MTGLALVVRDHCPALEYDLMTRTGRTLAEYMEMGADGRIALAAFIRYLPPDSALYRETHPKDETPQWMTTMKTNAILADFLDAYASANRKKGAKRFTYPRPNREGKSIGKGAIPVRDFESWWKSGA